MGIGNMAEHISSSSKPEVSVLKLVHGADAFEAPVSVHVINDVRRITPRIVFDRRELSFLFNLYGRKVAAGEWRDYALDFTSTKAIFSVYRRSSEYALYRIEKTPELARRQGAFSVLATNGRILRRGQDLCRVLRVLDDNLKLVKSD